MLSWVTNSVQRFTVLTNHRKITATCVNLNSVCFIFASRSFSAFGRKVQTRHSHSLPKENALLRLSTGCSTKLNSKIFSCY